MVLTLRNAVGEVENVRTTPAHPFAVKSIIESQIEQQSTQRSAINLLVKAEALIWAHASSLKFGDILTDTNGDQIEVLAAHRDGEMGTVYNFEVSGDHTYFVGEMGTWVHNQSSKEVTSSDKAEDPVSNENTLTAESVAAEVVDKLNSLQEKPTGIWVNITEGGPNQTAINMMWNSERSVEAGAILAVTNVRDKQVYSETLELLSEYGDSNYYGESFSSLALKAEASFDYRFSAALSKSIKNAQFEGIEIDSAEAFDAVKSYALSKGDFNSRKFGAAVQAAGQGYKKGGVNYEKSPDLARELMGHLLNDTSIQASDVLGVVRSINSPGIHDVLDVAGLTPLVGVFADVVNSAIYIAEDRPGMAAASAAMAVPGIDYIATGGKGMMKVGEVAAGAARLTGLSRAAELSIETAVRVASRACFAKGTPILTKVGLQPIEDIKVGDLVWSRSEYDTEVTAWRQVTAVAVTGEKVIYEVTISANNGAEVETFRTTERHPFWTTTGVDGNGGFVAAADLKTGDNLRCHDGSDAYVISIARTEDVEPVYNFSVNGFETYHVGKTGIWVHNTCPDNLIDFAKTLKSPHNITADDLVVGGKLRQSRIHSAGNRAPGFEDWLKKGNTARILPDGTVEYTAKSVKGFDAPVTVAYRQGRDGKYFPDFTPFTNHASGVKQFDIPKGLNGSRTSSGDFKLSNEAAVDYLGADSPFASMFKGVKPPKNWTWHHHENARTMMLVPTAINSTFTHTGGASYLRAAIAATKGN